MFYTGYSPSCPSNPQGGYAISLNTCRTVSIKDGFDLQTSAASCTATMNPNIPKPSFDRNVRVCSGAKDTGGCSAGQWCVPLAGSSAYGGVCIYQAGAQKCPTGYPTRTVYYNSYSDTRACSACTCKPSGYECRATITLYQATDCTGATSTAYATETNTYCSASNVVAIKPAAVNVYKKGTCSPSGGTLTGSVTPQKATTVCCAK